jgi:predicted N-acetyltransferase YhbS
VTKSVECRLNPYPGNQALNELYYASWPAHVMGEDFAPVLKQCLAHVCAYDDQRLIGFVKVAWDGRQHAFLLDPTVHPDYRHQGIGLELVRRATEASRDAGCETLHVDYAPELAPFYEACDFKPTAAGLIDLAR